MLKDSKGLKITLLVIVLIVMAINFLPGGNTYTAKQEVVATTKDSYNLTVKAVSGNISVIVDPSATQISASYSGTGRTRSKLSLSQTGSNVTISETISKRGFFKFFDFTSTPRMMVTIPETAVLTGLNVSTASGKISMETNIVAGAIKLASASGRVDFLDMRATDGPIEITVFSGSVDGYLTAADRVKVSVASGSIEIYRVESGDIDLTTASGSIYGEIASGNGKAKITSASGKIDMTLDAQTNATINAKTTSGKVTLGASDDDARQGSRDTATATIGDGSGSIEAKNASGGITIAW